MTDSSQPAGSGGKTRAIQVLVRVGLPVLVIVLGAGLAIGLIETSPKAKRKPPERRARLVEVQPVQIGNHRTLVHAMGTVRPAREVDLHPRVSGEIVTVNDEFVPGGHFEEGQMLVQIDPTDYKLAVQQREADVAEAQSDLLLEQGNQSVARREYEMLGETIKEEDRALVLRQPQMEKVRATLRTAQAALEQARLNLARTSVKAPFNATVLRRDANLGMQVSPTTALARMAGTDEYWIEVTVPVGQLQWIEIPRLPGQKASSVRVFDEAAWGAGAHRAGHVIRLLGDLEEEGRMARLLVSVSDPLTLQPDHANQPRLILGAYVRVEIEGIELGSVAAVHRQLFHDGDRLWVMNDRDELEIRPVEIAFRGRETLLVRSGLNEGERLVTTELPSPVSGMPLRTQSTQERGQ